MAASDKQLSAELGRIRAELVAIRRLLEAALTPLQKPSSRDTKPDQGNDEFWRGKDLGLTREQSEAIYGPAPNVKED